MIRRRLTLIVTGLLVLGCSCSGVPGHVIQPDRMARIIADIHLGEAVAEQNRKQFATDSMRQLFKQSIYETHGVTPVEVDSSMMWYGRNIDKYVEVYKEAEKILEEELANANEVAAAATERPPVVAFEAEGDSVDIWPMMRMRPVSPNLASDRLTFEIHSDRFWEKGDVYRLRFKGVDTPGKFDITLAIQYGNGSVEYSSASVAGDGWHDLYLHLNDTLTASLLYGDLAYPQLNPENVFKPGTRPQARIDSISLVRLRSSNGSKLPHSTQNIFNSGR